jgi:hypothetical protein
LSAELLVSPAAWRDPEVTSVWQARLAESDHLRAMYHSMAWVDHLGATSAGQQIQVIAVRDRQGRCAGVAPVAHQDVELDFVIGHRVLWKSRAPGLAVLAGEPLLAPDETAYGDLFGSIERLLPGCEAMLLHMVRKDGFCWRYLTSARAVHNRFVVYAPLTPGAGETYAISFPRTHEEYLSGLGSKKRRSIRKRLEALGAHGGGLPQLRCYRSPADVAPFLAAAEPVSRASWQYQTVGAHFEPGVDWPRKLGDLAERGILRSYVLFCGEAACAFVLGYQYGGVFHHVKTGYDRALAKLAPGIGILSLLIEDLYEGDPPTRLSFGFGDADYKREFGNVRTQTGDLILFRRTLRHRAETSLHAAFRKLVTVVRDRVRRRAPLRRPS